MTRPKLYRVDILDPCAPVREVEVVKYTGAMYQTTTASGIKRRLRTTWRYDHKVTWAEAQALRVEILEDRIKTYQRELQKLTQTLQKLTSARDEILGEAEQ